MSAVTDALRKALETERGFTNRYMARLHSAEARLATVTAELAEAKKPSVRLEDLLRVLDKAADHFLIPCQGLLALGKGGCPDCRDTLELKAELLKMASILRAEAQEKMKTGTKRRHHPAFDEYGEHR